jgi:hypothetical protein
MAAVVDPDEYFDHVDAGEAASGVVANDDDEVGAVPPPGDPRAEEELCGNLLYPGAGNRMLEVVGRIEPKHMSSRGYAAVLAACFALHERHEIPSVVDVAAEMTRANTLQMFENREFALKEMVAGCAVLTPALLAQRMNKIVERWRARETIVILQRAAAAGYRGADASSIIESARAQLDALKPPPKSEDAALSPSAVFAQWRSEGPLVHEPTGIATLDRLTGGGPVYGCRIYTPGAPDAGKTGFAVHVGDTWAQRGIAIGWLAIDEEASDVQTRLLQRRGFSRAQCEKRDTAELQQMEARLDGLPFLYFGPERTIEDAAATLDAFAKTRGMRAALFVDTIQAATCAATRGRDDLGPRDVVSRNVAALRAVATRYRMIGWGISEMNRGAYRSIEAAEQSNDMASGAESRAIEFSARLMLALRSVKDQRDLVEVRVVKNKLGPSNETLHLRIDREHMTFKESGAPEADPAELRRAEDEKKARNQRDVERDATALAVVVRNNPGLGVRELRGAARATGLGLGNDRFDAAIMLLKGGHDGNRLVDRNAGSKGAKYHLEHMPKGGVS